MPRKIEFRNPHPRKRTFFKEWRKKHDMTQQQLADELGTTKTRVSMKENGKEPYDQDYLEALANAVKAEDVASLLVRNPFDPEPIWLIWDQAKPAQRRQIIEVAKALLKPG
jgi:transcriptional regulator with XRE-family HTH domain